MNHFYNRCSLAVLIFFILLMTTPSKKLSIIIVTGEIDTGMQKRGSYQSRKRLGTFKSNTKKHHNYQQDKEK